MHRTNNLLYKIRMAGVYNVYLENIIARHSHVGSIGTEAHININGAIYKCICSCRLLYK